MTKATLLQATELVSTGDFILEDGTLWSHAASMGDIVMGSKKFSIDEDTVKNFVRVFSSGIRSKVPLDYDHGCELAADGKQPIPKSGTLLELAAVLTVDDLNDTMRAMIEASGRELDDPRNLGLWARWRPTPLALELIRSGQYTEMSIAFWHDYPNGKTGKSEGPAITSIALTNQPFNNDMIPIAASRSGGGTRADTPDKESQTMPTEAKDKPTVMLALAVLLGRTIPFGSEEEAAEAARVEITTLRTEKTEREATLAKLSTVVDAVKHETGEADPEKAVEKIRALKLEANSGKDEAARQRALNIQQNVRTVLAKYEPYMTVPTQRIYERELTRELEGGKELGKTDTEKALASMRFRGPAGGQFSAVNSPDSPADEDGKLTQLADSIVKEDARLSEMAKTNPNGALTIGLRRARRQIGA